MNGLERARVNGATAVLATPVSVVRNRRDCRRRLVSVLAIVSALASLTVVVGQSAEGRPGTTDPAKPAAFCSGDSLSGSWLWPASTPSPTQYATLWVSSGALLTWDTEGEARGSWNSTNDGSKGGGIIHFEITETNGNSLADGSFSYGPPNAPAGHVSSGPGSWTNTGGTRFVRLQTWFYSPVLAYSINWDTSLKVTGGDGSTCSVGDSAGNNGLEPHECPGSGGDPVNLATGNLHEEFNDFAIPGRGRGLTMGHAYNSVFAAVNGPLGYGWTTDFAMSLVFNGSEVVVNQENGAQATFTQSGSIYVAPSRVVGTLTHNGDGTWTLVRRGWERFTFSAAGRLTAISDPIGGADRTTIVHYDASNQIDYVQDGAGRRLNFAWVSGRIHTISDQASPVRTVRFEYSGAGDLMDVFDVAGGDEHFTYDSAHHLTRLRTPHQSATNLKEVVNEYDSSNRVFRQTDELGRQINFDFTVGGQTTVTDAKGNVTRLTYQNLMCTSITLGVGSAEQAMWLFDHDPATLGITRVTDPLSRVVATAVYDASGNVTSFTDGLGNVSSASYNQFNEPSWIKDGKQTQTTFTYDAVNGRLQSVSTPLLEANPVQYRTLQTFYDNGAHLGDATRAIDPNGQTWQLGYDANGDLNSMIDPLTDTTTISYNAIGWPTSMVTPKGNVTGGTPSQYTWTFGQNPFGDVTSVLQPPGTIQGTTTSVYDENRNLKSTTDAEGHLTQFIYDDANQLIQQKRADNSILSTDYWGDGSVKTQRDGANQPTAYAYDHQGRLTSVTDPLSRVTSYVYGDVASSVVGKQDPGGNCSAVPKTLCTTSTHDAAGRAKTVTYSDGTTPNITDMGYDADGRRTSVTTVGVASPATWVWDSLGRLLSSKDDGGTTTPYTYDLAGHVKTIGYPSGSVTRNYDNAGRWTSTTDWLGNLTQFGYDANSNNTSTTFPSASTNVDTYGVDTADRLMSTTMKQGATQTTSLTYDRYKTGLLKGVTSVGLPGSSPTYAYNSLNQLTTISGVTNFGYDGADNLVQMMGSSYQGFDAAHQLCWQAGSSTGTCAAPPSGATTFSYDSRGNRTAMTPPTGAPTTYSYDQANRLTSVAQTAPANGAGQFTSLPVARLADTRSATRTNTCGANGTSACVTPVDNTTTLVRVANNGGVPSSGVGAVLINLTASSANSTYMKVWADDGSPTPTSTALNLTAGQANAGLVTVKVPADGLIRVWTALSADLQVDVEGWFSAGAVANGTTFTPLTPARLADTQTATRTNTCGWSGTDPCWRLNQQQDQWFRVLNNGGVPATGVDSVVLNITVPPNVYTGYLKVYPDDGSALPGGTQISYTAGVAATNTVVVKPASLHGNGLVRLWSSIYVDVTIDVVGYYASTATNQNGEIVTTPTPTRVADTRSGLGVCTPSPCARLTAGATTTVQIAGQAGVPASGVAVALVAVTDVTPSGAGTFTLYAADKTPPSFSTVNYATNVTSLQYVALSATGAIKITSSAATDVVVDIQGWYTTNVGTPAAGWTYAYNGGGLRRSKTSPSAVVTGFTWSQASGLPMLVSEATGTTTTSYIYGPGGLPAEQVSTTGGTSTVRYLHHDQLGSTRLISDVSGNTLSTFTYDPYGKLSGSTGTVTTPLGFAGQYTDAETGFQYLRARYYDPATGQFLTRDPIESLTRDPYGYGLRAPTSASDPSGLSPLDWISGAAGWLKCAIGNAISWIGDHQDGIAQIIIIAIIAIVVVGVAAVFLAPAIDSTLVEGAVVDEIIGVEAAPLALPESSLPTAAEAQQLVQEAEPVGSALKDDIYHRAATFASEDIGSNGSVYRIVGGDGVEKTLIQMPGEVNDIAGRFEWIVNDQAQLTHQWFVKGGSINGLPITP